MEVLKRSDIKKFKEHFGGDDPVLGKYSKNWVLDHDHDTGMCRGIIDRDINQFIGKIESAYKRFVRHKAPSIPLFHVLNEISHYLVMSQAKGHAFNEVLHPEGVLKLYRQFSYKNASEQSKILKTMYKYTIKELNNMSKAERLKLYKAYFTDEKRIFKI